MLQAVIDISQEMDCPVPSGVFAETVTWVKHYTDRLFAFRITRPVSFRFRSGEFVMIGLPDADKPIFRAYSIASPSWDDELEFYSIKVPGGPLTERLKKIQPGDSIWMRKKSTGTLVNDVLLPGKRLWMFSTGTGVAPFASLIRDPETYEKFEQIILCHTSRTMADLTYGFDMVERTKDDPLIGEEASAKLIHYPTTTKEESRYQGRITDLITSGNVFSDLDLPPLDPTIDRSMICGSMAFLKDMKAILDAADQKEGSNANPAEFAVERAFVD